MLTNTLQQKELLERFKLLSPFEQTVLKICAVLNEDIAQTKLLNYFKYSGVKNEAGTQPTNAQLKAFKIKFRELDLSESYTHFKCATSISDYLARLASKEPYFKSLLSYIRQQYPIKYGWYWHRSITFDRLIRDIRIGFFTNDLTITNKALEAARSYFPNELSLYPVFQRIFNNPFDGEWLATFSEELQFQVIEDLLSNATEHLAPFEEMLHFLKKAEANNSFKKNTIALRHHLVTLLIFKGELKEAEQIALKNTVSSTALAHLGWISFLKGENDKALQHYETALTLFRKNKGNNKKYLPHFNGIFNILTLLKTGNFVRFETALKLIKASKVYTSIYELFEAVIRAQKNDFVNAEAIIESSSIDLHKVPIELYFFYLAMYWIMPEEAAKKIGILKELFKKANENGHAWLELELAALLSVLLKNNKLYKARQEVLEAETGIKSILNTVEKQETWQRALKALTHLSSTEKNPNDKYKSSRVAWLMDFKHEIIQPKEQTITKSGKWSKGRNIALKRLKSGEVESLSPQDLKIIKAIETEEYGYGYYGQQQYAFNFEKAVEAMIGHPYIFLEDGKVSVELTKEEPQLLVEQKGDQYNLQFSTKITKKGINIVKETPTRYKVFVINDIHLQIANILRGGKITVPLEAKDDLVEAIGGVASIVNVQSDLGHDQGDIPVIDADPRPFLHLLPSGDGFKLEIFTKPFTTTPPYFKPGSGGQTVITEINGSRVQTRRDLALEKAKTVELVDICPTLQLNDNVHKEWSFEETEDCLQVLLEIDPLRTKDSVVVEWPKGAEMQISHQASFDNMYLKVKKQNDWFGLSGELKLDDNLVMNMKQLLEMVESSPSRFIQLSDGKFLALTRQFQERLQELNKYTESSGKNMKFHPLAALAMEDFFDEAGDLEADLNWRKQINHIREAKNYRPEVPSTLKADLRSYQEEGYHWLSQLAHWGVGACLADDMGLGKTLQALTVMLNKAQDGPSLVVAPASVTRNWMKEIDKFTPTLVPLLFGDGDRKETIFGLKPYDVLITSYGLMQQESELINTVEWNVIALDEAQAIKNRATKRSKAAMLLKGNFKIATTGTPIENHLGELWNLFRFINPGLLGSLDKFNKKFALPIEKNKDIEANKQLQKLIRPFILRRKKSAVLDELPSKTEVTLTVSMSQAEMAFYEALRQRAVESLESIDNDSNQKRFQILAEITRLRQACCNPQLVDSSLKIPSSKLKLFTKVTEELIENGHKALVFSQFVGHLKILEKNLKKRKVSYQYLDGSTPAKKRQKYIDEFQAGKGDIFLISLKAGGLGLNLTAADYVLHMDPWWNPAVEDQASDRAHRMGQKRPVTIYRLVVQNSIEEKIVKLHHEKRNLADSLLAGTDRSAKMNADELLNLIKEG